MKKGHVRTIGVGVRVILKCIFKKEVREDVNWIELP
jgi:hypothetical protein